MFTVLSNIEFKQQQIKNATWTVQNTVLAWLIRSVDCTWLRSCTTDINEYLV